MHPHHHNPKPPFSGTALITGASSGIGQAIARELAARSYPTILLARRAELLESLATELRVHAPCTAVPFDLLETQSIPTLTHRLIADHAPISVLINCAGSGAYRSFLDESPYDMSRLMRLNHEAAALLTRGLLPDMIARGRGHIVNISSMSAIVGAWGHCGYAASKSAMRNLTQSLRCEFRPHGVRFTVVYPGIVRTPYFNHPDMAPLWDLVKHRAIEPERVARAVATSLWTERASVHVPWYYRAIDLIAAVSNRAAIALVRGGSAPPRRAEPAPAWRTAAD